MQQTSNKKNDNFESVNLLEVSATPLQDIAIEQLKTGMYVTSISFQNKKVNVKSEGYVLTKKSIDKLIKNGIKRVIVDPSKDKNLLEKQISPANSTSQTSVAQKIVKPNVSLDQEMQSANKLYKNAKKLQEKILLSIQAGQPIDVGQAKETTDAMVSSIFRNQDALTCMSRLRDKGSYLIEHALNCSILMTIFAKHLALKSSIIEELALGAFLHDIGKVFIPDDILKNKGKLNEKEIKIIKSHVALGLKILEDTPKISHIAVTMVTEHHERIDGSGYPQSLKNENISKYGRMIAIVDSYDAMTAERVFKTSMQPINAFKILMAESPSSYDQSLVEQFIQCLGVYPVGTLVKLTSGKLGLISKLNPNKPLQPFVRVFYNTRLNQSIALEEINLSKKKYNDQIEKCIKPEEFNINLIGFFKAAFIE